MDVFAKLLDDLSSPTWWFTAVIMGLLINMAAAYAIRWFDSWREKYSSKQREENEARRAEFQRKADMLVVNPSLLVLEGYAELRQREIHTFGFMLFVTAAPWLVLADHWAKTSPTHELPILLFRLLVTVIFMFAGGFIVAGFNAAGRASEHMELMKEVQRRLQAQTESGRDADVR